MDSTPGQDYTVAKKFESNKCTCVTTNKKAMEYHVSKGGGSYKFFKWKFKYYDQRDNHNCSK